MFAKSVLAWLGIALAACVLFVAGAPAAEETVVYVSPEGNDAWSGTLAEPNAGKTDGPVATPQKARDLVRAIKTNQGQNVGPIQVCLRGGAYRLAEPLVLQPQDSGTPEAPVVWTAYQDEQPVISGGQRITGWTKTTINDREAWTAPLPADRNPAEFREMWLDGARLARARWPKKGTLGIAGLGDDAPAGEWNRGVNQFVHAEGDLAAWPSATDGEAIVGNRWVESRLPIASIDPRTRTIRFTKKSVFLLEPGDPYWIENVRECLTEPGEFHVDVRGKAVFLIPPAGVDPNQAQVVAPRLAQVLRLEGEPAAGRFVEHVVFRGITFSHTEWYFDHGLVGQEAAAKLAPDIWRFAPDPTRSGFSQAAIGVPGAIWAAGARSCALERCEVSHIGNYAIELAGGCQKNRVSRCTLDDLGAGGVKIGEVVVREADNEKTSGNEVSDCTIADGGHLFPSCVAVWIGQSSHNVVAHNDINRFWYTGISVGWTWGYGPAAAQRNVVEYNHVHHIGVKDNGDEPFLSDMGCIYTLGNHEGTVIRHNHFHDVAGRKYGGWGIYFDEGTSRILAENNLVHHTTHGGFHQHYGKENVFRNNIIAFARDAQIVRSRLEEHRSFTFERNVVLWDRGTLLSGNWSKLNVAFDHNTYWRVGGGEIRFADRTWDQWREAGMDQNSKIADPRFANPAQGDFTLPPDAKANLAGFEPFDLSTVGPR
ncbi:MAG: right-handed parallel beta-helix repeat-containing protein [Pirellulales bacterium]|nr:right-handed parallel beta-helix repeat-containing protein [Pirellulales bacterium]